VINITDQIGDDQKLSVKPIHPFPARMAPSIPWENLISLHRKPLRILDPMLGSGTTAVVARSLGHVAVGFDSDPLSVLVASTWCTDIDPSRLVTEGKNVLEKAIDGEKKVDTRQAYPVGCDSETRTFIRYWFDRTTRRQLLSLSSEIYRIRDYGLRASLWCAFSRMIITKHIGVSLAMDISHSRPHRVYRQAPIKPFDAFLPSVNSIAKRLPFKNNECRHPHARIMRADARRVPLGDGCIDMIITSPPYLNAIDYMRGHKLTLVWMGYSSGYLRGVRSGSIGAERGLDITNHHNDMKECLSSMGEISGLSNRTKAILSRYVVDMNSVLSEISRVLVKKGQAILVVGDSNINRVFISNSTAIVSLATKHGFQCSSVQKRELPDNKRYLPPPSLDKTGVGLRNRMREEAIVTLVKG
jgi:hypothetical protein